ncbi:hypothetical protein KST10_07395 [Fusobacterium animalis]|nr:hypothetical protein [Fusobacterium nucleatum]MCL4582990.1 hypothetical protein [Fusobacterium nucleatum YWH7054]
MKTYIISDFVGIIDDIIIKNQKIFYSVEHILSKIEDKFGECYNKKFVEDLVNQIDYLYLKLDDFEFSKFEIEINLKVKKFNEIKFSYYGDEFYGIEEFNNNISKGIYNL